MCPHLLHRPPLPDVVVSLLEASSLCYLSTHSDDMPHLCLMNFTYHRRMCSVTNIHLPHIQRLARNCLPGVDVLPTIMSLSTDIAFRLYLVDAYQVGDQMFDVPDHRAGLLNELYTVQFSVLSSRSMILAFRHNQQPGEIRGIFPYRSFKQPAIPCLSLQLTR